MNIFCVIDSSLDDSFRNCCVLSTYIIQSIKLPRYCYFRETNLLVALKEIRLQEEEGIPFTAIREGKYFTGKLHILAGLAGKTS